MKKKTVLILGGSGLLGSKIINKYADNKNFKVINLDIKTNVNKKQNYFFQRFDMKDNNIEKNLKQLIKLFGVPHIFCDCSYLDRRNFTNVSFKNFSKSNFDHIISNWLSPVFYITIFILERMKKKKIQGNILLTSSIYGRLAQDPVLYAKTNISENIAYSSIKSSIDNFVKNAASFYGEFNIKINSICPGGIYATKDKNFKDKNFINNYLKKVPLKRFATPEEISNLYYFLGSDNNSYITGQNILIDGGYSIR